MISEDSLKLIGSLPQLSPISQNVLRLLQNPNWKIEELELLVIHDPILSAECLRRVNSPEFGLRKEVTSVSQALIHLGLLGVFQISMQQSIGKMLFNPLKGYKAPAHELFKASLLTATLSRRIIQYIGESQEVETAFTAGLLHDIGKIIQSKLLENNVDTLKQELLQFPDKTFDELEREISGTDHTELGVEVAKYWGLPAVYQSVIRYHHRPHEADPRHQNVVYTVHIAQNLSQMMGVDSLDSSLYPFNRESLEKLSITSDTLEQFIFDSHLECEQIKEKLWS